MATPLNTLEYVITITANLQDMGKISAAARQLEDIGKKNLEGFQKLDKGAKQTGLSFTPFTRNIGGMLTNFAKMRQEVLLGNGQLVTVEKTFQRMSKTTGGINPRTSYYWKELKDQAKATDEIMGGAAQTFGEVAGGFAKLAIRAAVVVPIWMIVRTVYGTLQKLITDSLQTWMELSVEMARVGSTGFEAARNMDFLKSAVISMSSNSSRGFKEVASAMYQLGSAGLNVTEMVQGLPHIMNLTIASFANAEETAKLVAGAYNVFGDSIKGTYTVGEKFQHIADILTYTYAKQQVELADLGNAMSYVASAASLVNVDFDTLITTIGFLNTGMLRGSKAGVALMNAFIEIAAKGEKLADLGVAFDPTKPMDLVNIIDQLHDKYGDAALSLNNLKEIMGVFGQRGGRAVAQLIANYDRWKLSLKGAEADFKDFAERMKEVAETSLPAAWDKMWNSMKANMIEILGGTEGALRETLSRMAKEMDRAATLRKYAKFLPEEKQAPGIVEETMKTVVGIAIPALTGNVQGIKDVINALNAAENKRLNTILEEVEAQKWIWDLYQKKTRELAYQEKFSTKQRSSEQEFATLAKEAVEQKMTEAQLEEKVYEFLIKQNETRKVDLKVVKETAKELADTIKLQQQAAEAKLTFDIPEQRGFRETERAVKYEIMRARGVKDSVVEYQKLEDIISEANLSLRIANEEELTRAAKAKSEGKSLEEQRIKFQHQYLSAAEAINSTGKDYLLILKRTADGKQYIQKIDTQRLETIKAINVEQLKYVQELRGEFKSLFQDILMGEEDIGNVFVRMGDSMRKSIAGAIADSLSRGILDSGLGDQFGAMGVAFEDMFTGPKSPIERGIVAGSQKGGTTIETKIDDSTTRGAKRFYDAIVSASELATQYEAAKKGILPPLPPGGAGGITLKGGFEEQQNALFNEPSFDTGYLNNQERLDTLKIEREKILADIQEKNARINNILTAAEPGSRIPSITTGAEDRTGELMGFLALKNALDESTKRLEEIDIDAAAITKATEVGTALGAEKGTEKGILPSANQIANIITSLPSLLGTGGAAGGAGGIFGATGLIGAAGGAFGPYLNMPVGGVKTGMYSDLKTGKMRNAAGQPVATYGDLFGGAVTGALMGYSQYQSMTARGVNPAYSGISAGLTGVGSMLMMIPGGWTQVIGGVMMLGGMLMSAFAKGGKKETVSEQSRTETKQVTSRIDVTNKQLEVVNRNLVAMRDDLTYIMQQSYYFRERSTEDRFAIDSQRGNM